MEIKEIHSFDLETEQCKSIQYNLSKKVMLENAIHIESIKLLAGVDIAYYDIQGVEYGVCCVIVFDFRAKRVIEKTYSTGKVTMPYIPGYLAFRELPLIMEAVKKLSCTPDVFMFDGNGILHPRKMGIATHASFFLNKPCIGIAKSYLKIDDIIFIEPKNEENAFEDIIVNDEVYGRALRTHIHVKPIFVSCGNYIDLETASNITLRLITKESRLPIPVRLADLETRRLKRLLVSLRDEW
ncbi:endonuclease V [Sporosarcina sp. GW1-11]|uniref:endonuclease V n=1 Tax=Sporosarcina sp. GW1-11 TaxID=2899126 RepID=UPI00294CF1E5|nr:endonuclease V [Sporosarcina sp. GW1-11]MDV6378159.1 endonuclease V [Sporosarcina sp. GW1-11]